MMDEIIFSDYDTQEITVAFDEHGEIWAKITDFVPNEEFEHQCIICHEYSEGGYLNMNNGNVVCESHVRMI